MGDQIEGKVVKTHPYGPLRNQGQIGSFKMSLASKYQEQSATLQRKTGMEFIWEIQPRSGDIVLDLGCGTGELSAFMADLVGSEGRVVGVDPNAERIRLARETHGSHSNLTFEIGSSYGFPGDGEQTYDLVFSNYVLQWVQNKQELFAKVFRCLKTGGRMTMLFMPHCSKPLQKLLKELGLHKECEHLFKEKLKYEENDVVEAYLGKEGMKVLRMSSKQHRWYYSSAQEFCDFHEASSGGLLDLSSVTKQRINEVEPHFMENGKLVNVLVTTSLVAKKIVAD